MRHVGKICWKILNTVTTIIRSVFNQNDEYDIEIYISKVQKSLLWCNLDCPLFDILLCICSLCFRGVCNIFWFPPQSKGISKFSGVFKMSWHLVDKWMLITSKNAHKNGSVIHKTKSPPPPGFIRNLLRYFCLNICLNFKASC